MILALGGIEGLSMKHVKTLAAVERLMRYSKPSPQTFLMHYDVKGMKWGIRRTPEELRYNSSSVIASVNRYGINVVTSTGDRIASMSSHAGDQARQREVSAKEIIDALRSPLYIKPVKYDAQVNSTSGPVPQFALIQRMLQFRPYGKLVVRQG